MDVYRSSRDERRSKGCWTRPPRSLVARGPELNTRLMETYAETRYSRGRRRSRSSPRSSSLSLPFSSPLYLSAFPPPPPPSTLCIPISRPSPPRDARPANFFESLSLDTRACLSNGEKESSRHPRLDRQSIAPPRALLRHIVKADSEFFSFFFFCTIRSIGLVDRSSMLIETILFSFFFLFFRRDIHYNRGG